MRLLCELSQRNDMKQRATQQKRAAIGIVLNTDKSKVLLIKRRDVPIWVLPGGGIEPGESPEEAVVREVREETGLIVSVKRQIALYSPINRLAKLTFTFECKVKEGSLSTGNETRGIDFFSFDALPFPFFFIHREWLEDAQTPASEIICKTLTQITYFNLFKYFFRHPVLVIRGLLSRFNMPYNSSLEN